MTSLILQTAARSLVAVLLLFSIFLLLRGHDEPGGGFIGGLVAAAAFTLYAFAYDVPSARRVLGINPQTMIGFGLLFAGGAGIIAMFIGEPFLTGLWLNLNVPGFGDVHLGTALIFDIGVFLVVVGVTMLIVLTLAEEG
jgi:multicomponent Na+:H+ antiporter subunit B